MSLVFDSDHHADEARIAARRRRLTSQDQAKAKTGRTRQATSFVKLIQSDPKMNFYAPLHSAESPTGRRWPCVIHSRLGS